MAIYKGSVEILNLISQKTPGLNTYNVYSIEQLSSTTGFNSDLVRRIVEGLKEEGFVSAESSESTTFLPNSEYKLYYSSEFPEFSVYKKAKSGKSITDLTDLEKSIGLRWAKQKGFVSIEGGKLVPSKTDEDVIAQLSLLKAAYSALLSNKEVNQEVREELIQRKLVDRKSTKSVSVQYSGKSYNASELAGEFDISVESANAPVGKSHPISVMSGRMRTIMAEMGFSEMSGDIVESSFWNFDALFQPQDHPAREMADTFYI